MKFILESKYKPAGDQPKAIKSLVDGVNKDKHNQVLLGATGTGKTFTVANVIEQTGRSTLVLSHNKTLAGQLYTELKLMFPKNRVEYFISYFDYYKPEAYMPATDTYIDKTSKSNWDIEAMRMSAANALLSDEPVIIVASVASIYGAQDPLDYEKNFFEVRVGESFGRDDFLNKLVLKSYERNDIDQKAGTFRVRGDVIDITPGHTEEYYIRIEMFGDDVESIKLMDPLNHKAVEKPRSLTIFPANAFTISSERVNAAVKTIEKELEERLAEYKREGKVLELQRLEHRVKQDLESLREFGFCPGMENYSRHFDVREANSKPFTIIDYLFLNASRRGQKPLLVVDESHMMVPQLHGMYAGDRARKENLVEYGFRLPSALDNRPLKFEEFDQYDFNRIFVSATPAKYEIDLVEGEIIPQIIRPTGLLDPIIEVVKKEGQIEHIFDQLQDQKKKKERTLILTTTKRMAEELTKYLQEKGEKIAYMHSEHKTFERQEILRKLRVGVYDTVVGINLLREGIDLPEVSLICVIDADQESFFRSTSSLIQIIGRAARNSNGRVTLYADKMSKAMNEAMIETARRRKVQMEFNEKNGIIPRTIIKDIPEPIQGHGIDGAITLSQTDKKARKSEKKKLVASLRGQMLTASRQMDYERALQLRDLILEIEAED